MSKSCRRSSLQRDVRGAVGVTRPCVAAALLIFSLLLAAGSSHAAPDAARAGAVAMANDATDVSAGDNHSCAALSDGRIKCWGNNAYGPLGDGTEVTRWTPVEVSGISTATQVSGGYSHSCAVLADGTAKCWGWNLDGQLGNGSQATQLTPVTVSGITTATQVATGRTHSCARLSDGTVKCWGSGGLGDGTLTSSLTPVAVSGITTATQISAGNGHTCARLTDATIRCWGANVYGELGDGTTTARLTPVAVSGITTATQVATHNNHTCAALSSGTAKCWGYNAYRQLGDGTTTNRSTPVSVSGMTTATQLATGEFHTCARLSDGTAKCWGLNAEGQLGDGTRTNRSTPVLVSGLTTATEMTLGIFHSCASLTDGTLKCWGWDVEGNLGDGTMTYQYTPVLVSGITTATQVATGGLHSCTRLSDGTAKCWGVNFAGTLGDGTTTDRTTPVPVSGLTTATEVAAGTGHSCARLSDAAVQCWGANGAGQLGDGTTTNRSTPVAVSGITTATQVATGSDHSCVRLSDGTVRCWGSNSNGKLGDGTTTNRSTPVAVSGITTATQVAGGMNHTCARLSDSTVKCWGWNFYGQLGDGTQTNSSTPVAVSGITTATQITVGDLHSCALLANGTAKCWGSNTSFQFGDGSAGTGIPSGITTATQISGAHDHSCARVSDGTLRCWGLNYDGQIGDGTFAIRSTPNVVSGITNATQVSTGSSQSSHNGSYSCARLSDGTIKCWGAAYSGQLGNGVVGYSLIPAAVAIAGGGGPPPLPTITTTSLPGGQVNQAYSQSVTATSGTTPYSWSLAAGALPSGLSLAPTGTPSATISGTPTAAGTYNFTVRVTDSASETDTREILITVAPPPPNPPLLDNFNRSPENPVSQGGNWAPTGISGGPGAPLSQNRLRTFPSPAGGFSYRVTPYPSGDMEAAATVVTRPSTNHWLSVFICLQDTGTTGWDGYELRAKVTSGPDLWEIRRVANGVSTVLSSTNFEITVGGAMLLRRSGEAVEAWWKPSGGSWGLKRTVNDPTYSGGRIGAGGWSSGALDDFAGGSADVSVTQSGWPYGSVGTTVPYSLDVVNAGPSPAVTTRLTATAPAGVTIVNASVSAGSCPSLAPLVCDLGDLAPGMTRSVTVTIRLDVEANLGTAVSLTTGALDPAPSSNTLTVRTVGLASEQRLAAQYRPALLFDSGSSELWRPVAIDSLLSESFSGERHKICAASFACVDVTAESGITSEWSFLDLHGSSEDSYTSHACRAPGLNDCDAGAASVLYYEPTADGGTGYRYVDYWWFYRWNDSKIATGDHEGDWEGLTIALDPTGPPSNTGPPVAAYALFAAHDQSTWSAYLGNPANVHTPAYIGEGTHSSNPSPDFACGDFDLERCFEGPIPWGRNSDTECAELCVKPLADQAATWLTWPGRWGPNEEGTFPGGASPGSPGEQGRYQCVKNLFTGDCPAPPPGSSLLLQSTAQGAVGFSPATCDAWKGSQAAVVLCDADRLKKAFDSHALDERVAPPVEIRNFEGRVISAPGLTQAIGGPLATGDTVAIAGPLSDGQELTVRIRHDSRHWVSTARAPSVSRGRELRILIGAGKPTPVIQLQLPNGDRRRSFVTREVG